MLYFSINCCNFYNYLFLTIISHFNCFCIFSSCFIISVNTYFCIWVSWFCSYIYWCLTFFNKCSICSIWFWINYSFCYCTFSCYNFFYIAIVYIFCIFNNINHIFFFFQCTILNCYNRLSYTIFQTQIFITWWIFILCFSIIIFNFYFWCFRCYSSPQSTII